MKRIMIIGCSGSGKSTLARRLGKITGIPVTHVDKLNWGKGWVLRPRDKFQASVRNAVQQSEWIFDGNNTLTYSMRIALADTLILLDLPTRVCMYRMLKRTIFSYGKTREDSAPGCPERFDWEFVEWIYNYRKNRRPRDLNYLQNAPADIATYHFRNQKSVDDFIVKLSKNSA